MQVSIFQRRQQPIPSLRYQFPIEQNKKQLKLAISQSVRPKNTSSINMLRHKREFLPQIQSPFLKKTIYNLFPFKPSLSERYNNESKHNKQTAKSPILNPNQLLHAPSHKIFNNIEFDNQTSSPTKIKWNVVNKSKKQKQQLATQIKPQFPSKLSIPITPPEAAHLSSLKQASERAILNYEMAKSEQSHRQYKSPNYVAKHKMTESLYKQQKHQIKVIRDYLTQKHSNSVGKSISIKTYSKFFPNVITIKD